MRSGILRVLLVEDDPTDLGILRGQLARCRSSYMRVSEAAILSDALASLARQPVDAVLLDLDLPDSRGLSTCTRFLEAAPGIPLVVLTGLEDESVAIEAVQQGAQDFLIKGRTDPDGLGRALRYAIERHAMLSQLRDAVAEARAGEASVRRLLARSYEGLVVVDCAGAIRLANASAAALLGHEAEALGGKAWGDVAPGSVEEAGASPTAGASEIELVRPDGSRVPTEVRVSTIEWAGQTARLVSLFDLRDRRRAARLALAQGVQRTFLPERCEVGLPCVQAAALNELCEDVSGDFYDFVSLPDGRLAVAVGDVTGHGLGAALLMAQARAFFRAYCVTGGADLAGLMRHMNDALGSVGAHGTFLTLFVAFVDGARGHVEWANAGHVPALVLREGTAGAEPLPATSPPLWILPGVEPAVGPRVTLGPGDLLLICSDGVTEALSRDGELLGLARVAEAARGSEGLTPPRLVEALRTAVRAWSGSHSVQDDLTLVALRCRPTASVEGFKPTEALDGAHHQA